MESQTRSGIKTSEFYVFGVAGASILKLAEMQMDPIVQSVAMVMIGLLPIAYHLGRTKVKSSQIEITEVDIIEEEA